MATNIRRLVALILAVSMVMSLGVNAFAASEQITIDKKAQWVDENDPTLADVTLTVSGDVEAMGTDIVFLMGNGPANDAKLLECLIETMNEILVTFGDSGATVKFGLVAFAEGGNETIMDLTEMTEGNVESTIEAALNAYGTEGDGYSGVNLHSALLTAKDMLDSDDTVPADRKHMIVISTGLTYFFDDENGNSSTIVATDPFGNYCWGFNSWLRFRNNTSDTSKGYVIPFGWTWEEYWKHIVDWVENDGNKYVYTLKGNTYLELNGNPDNKKLYTTDNGYPQTNKYGYLITDPEDQAAAAAVAVPAFSGAANPEEVPNAAHALNYEYAQYMSWKVFKEMQDAGYNCYAVANGSPVWLQKNQIGRSFMDMLAGGDAPVYSETDDFFDPIHDSILYSVGSGSYVEDYMGYDADAGYDFDFVTDAETITLTVGDTVYTTTKLENAKDGYDHSYIFTAPGAETAAYALDYVHGNGTTEEMFKWYFYESVSDTDPVYLSYQVKLGNKQTAVGEYTVYTNEHATLYPADGEAVDFPKPELKYEVKPVLNKDDHYNYIIGYPDGTVQPVGSITREEVATIFYRLLDEESREALTTFVNPFTDVDAGRWSNEFISTLANAGIINGYEDGTFRPSATITRAEFATIAARFDKLETTDQIVFSDINGHWAESYIESAALKGWVKGYPDGTFLPNEPIKRAEAMCLINSVLERQVTAEGLHPDAIQWPDNTEDKWYYWDVLEATNHHIYTRDENTLPETWVEMKEALFYPNR